MTEDDVPPEAKEAQMAIREELLGRLSSEKFGLRKREVSVMTRLSNDMVEILDALVELEVFKSRSEAVAAFVERAIAARRKLFEEIRTQGREIAKKKEAAALLAQAALGEPHDEALE